MAVTVTVKMLSGDVLSIEFPQAPTGDQLYRRVWSELPEEVRPAEIWRMMLLADGEWVRPVLDVVTVSDLCLWVDAVEYPFTFHRDWNRDFANLYHYQWVLEGDTRQEVTIYVHYLGNRYYFPEAIRNHPVLGHVTSSEEAETKLSVLADRFQDISPCFREQLYSMFAAMFEDVLEVDREVLPLYQGEDEDEDEDEDEVDEACMRHPDQIEEGEDAAWEMWRQESRWH